MKKLALRIDSLVVESFQVATTGTQDGTVMANAVTPGVSCANTCPVVLTCELSCDTAC
jgi:hypothetical protein